MTQPLQKNTLTPNPSPRGRGEKGWLMFTVAPLLMCLVTGCASVQSGDLFTPPWKKSAKKDDLTKERGSYLGRGLERELVPPAVQAELDAAKQLFQEKKYAEAETRYHKLAQEESAAWWSLGGILENESAEKEKAKRKMPKIVREEAMFYEAECQRVQMNYRQGSDTYSKLLISFPRSQYTPGACQGLFQIADHWLEPTRQQMKEYHAQLKGERWFVTPASWIHFNKDMPTMDAEGNALLLLNTVVVHDINGPLGEKALLYLGTTIFYRKDYKEADFYFTKLFQDYPNGDHAATALKQAVICKQLSTGGSVYDCRGVEESKKLLMTGQTAYKELAQDEKWVAGQLTSIAAQQADRDYRIAEFYRRTGHPGSSYFYFELVRRRYPGSSYATSATTKMNEIRAEVEREQAKSAAEPGPVAAPSNAARPVLDPRLPQTPDVALPPRTLPPGLNR